MPTMIDLTGQKFGRLMVLRLASKDKRGCLKWLCRCECNKEKVIRGGHLKSGHTKSCGCLAVEQLIPRVLKHGHIRDGKPSGTYGSWQAMIGRCTNPNNKYYHNYGGRGIKVCERWRNSFVNFLEDMGERPPGYSLDRIKNKLGYYIENCKWSTREQQMRNTRKNHLITFNEKTQCVADWSDETGISASTIHARLWYGWSIEKTLTTSVQKREGRL